MIMQGRPVAWLLQLFYFVIANASVADAQKRCEAIEENSKKEKASLEENIATLQSKNEDTEDLLKAKQRKLDRLSDENDSLLGQIDSYCAQLKDAANLDAKVKTDHESNP